MAATSGDLHSVRNPLRIRVVSTAREARTLVRGGYCPVECAFGTESVVDKLGLDHHATRHDLPGVAIRAYSDLFGARRRKPWFAVTGVPDEDLTWAIGSLAGLLPHPSREKEFAGAPAEMREMWTRDWSPLVALINRTDTSPYGVDLLASDEGRMMVLWRLRASFPIRDTPAFYAGVDRWRAILGYATEDELDAVPGLLRRRLEAIERVRHERIDEHVVLVNSSIWGFGATYARQWHERLAAPVLFVFQPGPSGRGTVTVSAPNRRTTEALFGERGLLDVFPRLKPPGWGGRPLIGGSSRGRRLTWEQARAAAKAAAKLAGG